MSYRDIMQRCALIGLEPLPLFFLLWDCAIVLSLSLAVLQKLKVKFQSTGELAIASGLVSLSCIVLTVIILGTVGCLSWKNILLLHTFLWFILALTCKNFVEETVQSTINLLQRVFRPIFLLFNKSSWQKRGKFENLLFISVILVLLLYLLLAIFSLPLNYDSNTYRLTRVGYWLQEKNINRFLIADTRQNYMAINADLVMLWITSFFRYGYPLVQLVQFFGGVLSCLAIYEFARIWKFARLWRFAAVVMFLGIPNSAVQFFTSQTDLFTTGCLYAGLIFLYKALRENKLAYYTLFGAGLGLSLGAKGTVFYWGPGLLFLFVSLVFLNKPKLVTLSRGLIVSSLAIVLLGGFNYVRNYREYRNPFAPSNSFRYEASKIQSQDIAFKAVAYFWQLFEPNSNLPYIRPLTDYIFDNLQRKLADPQAFTTTSLKKIFIIQAPWLKRYGLNEDFASFGFFPFLCSIIGSLYAFIIFLKKKDFVGLHMFLVFVSLMLFMIFFVFMQRWTVHKYRYFVLQAPFLSILAIYPLQRLQFNARFYLLGLIVFSQLYMAFYVGYESRTHGLKAVLRPYNVPNYLLWNEITGLTQKLGNRPHTLAVVRRTDKWLAPFLRNVSENKIRFFLPQDIYNHRNLEYFFDEKGCDAVVMDTGFFPVLELRRCPVIIPSRRNTLIAVERRTPGAKVTPLVIERGIMGNKWSSLTPSFFIVCWKKDTLMLTLKNPTPLVRHIFIESSIEKKDCLLQIGQSVNVEIQVRSNDIVKLSISPAFVPSRYGKSPDNRLLGIKIFPEAG